MRAYPRPWRERYAGEVGELTDELVERDGRSALAVAANLARSGLGERVQKIGSRPRIAALGLVALAVLGLGFGLSLRLGPSSAPQGVTISAARATGRHHPPPHRPTQAVLVCRDGRQGCRRISISSRCNPIRNKLTECVITLRVRGRDVQTIYVTKTSSRPVGRAVTVIHS